MKRIALIAMLLSSSLVSMAGVYKWTDEQGNVHFGDKPVKGSEKVKIQPPVIAVPQAIPVKNKSNVPQADNVAYQLAIASPVAQETIRSAEGIVNVSLTVSPVPTDEVSYKVYFDGQLVDGAGSSLNLRLSGVERGSHQVRAVMVGENGQALAESQGVTFFLRQPSVNSPKRKKKH